MQQVDNNFGMPRKKSESGSPNAINVAIDTPVRSKIAAFGVVVDRSLNWTATRILQWFTEQDDLIKSLIVQKRLPGADAILAELLIKMGKDRLSELEAKTGSGIVNHTSGLRGAVADSLDQEETHGRGRKGKAAQTEQPKK